MKSVSKNIICIGLVLFMVSCMAPQSKESYLEKFESFVGRVEKNHKQYNQKDWEWTDSQFEKYNTDWYLEFVDEFTLQDQIKIKSLIIRYHSYKNKEDLGEMLRKLFEEDVDGIREKVEDYIENDMDGHLDKLIEGAEEIGDSAVKVLEDIIQELDNSF